MGVFCTDYPPPSKLSQHAVQKVLWSDELLLLPGQTKRKELGAKAFRKIQKVYKLQQNETPLIIKSSIAVIFKKKKTKS